MGGSERLSVVAERLSIVAHIVIHIAKHRVEIPLEARHVEIFCQMLRLFHREHRLVGLLLFVEDDGVVQQRPRQMLLIAAVLIVFPTDQYQRVGLR